MELHGDTRPGPGHEILPHDRLMDRRRSFCAGPTAEVITARNIRKGYEVDAVIDNTYGRPHVVVV